jgi:hypothetical protein
MPIDGDPAVPPEAAVVVEHLGCAGDELLREAQRPAGVPGEQNALGDGFMRADVDRL